MTVTASTKIPRRRFTKMQFQFRLALCSVAAMFLARLPMHAQTKPAQAPLRDWKLSAKPLLAIGNDGNPKTEFFRLLNVWRLANGSVAVVDGSTRELRVFDAQGKFLHSFGRKGAGPGEFQGMQWTARFGDTAIVYDGNSRRISTISLIGAPKLVAELPVRGDEERGFDIAGRLRDGRWVAHALGMPNMKLPLGVQRLTGAAGLLPSNAAASVKWIVEDAPDLSVLIHNPDASSKMVSVNVTPFASSLSVASSGSAMWIGDTAGDSLMRYDAVTAKRTTVRLPDAPVALTSAIIDYVRDQQLAEARTDDARRTVTATFQSKYLPKNQPVFSELLPGFGDELWVQRFVARSSEPVRYVIVSGNAAIVARAVAPPEFRVTDVGRDYVAGVYKDADGVESARVYGLTR